MKRRDFWITDEQHEILKAYQERTGASATDVLRDAINAYPPLDPCISGQRILGIVARTESGFVNLGWRRG